MLIMFYFITLKWKLGMKVNVYSSSVTVKITA